MQHCYPPLQGNCPDFDKPLATRASLLSGSSVDTEQLIDQAMECCLLTPSSNTDQDREKARDWVVKGSLPPDVVTEYVKLVCKSHMARTGQCNPFIDGLQMPDLNPVYVYLPDTVTAILCSPDNSRYPPQKVDPVSLMVAEALIAPVFTAPSDPGAVGHYYALLLILSDATLVRAWVIDSWGCDVATKHHHNAVEKLSKDWVRRRSLAEEVPRADVAITITSLNRVNFGIQQEGSMHCPFFMLNAIGALLALLSDHTKTETSFTKGSTYESFQLSDLKSDDDRFASSRLAKGMLQVVLGDLLRGNVGEYSDPIPHNLLVSLSSPECVGASKKVVNEFLLSKKEADKEKMQEVASKVLKNLLRQGVLSQSAANNQDDADQAAMHAARAIIADVTAQGSDVHDGEDCHNDREEITLATVCAVCGTASEAEKNKVLEDSPSLNREQVLHSAHEAVRGLLVQALTRGQCGAVRPRLRSSQAVNDESDKGEGEELSEPPEWQALWRIGINGRPNTRQFVDTVKRHSESGVGMRTRLRRVVEASEEEDDNAGEEDGGEKSGEEAGDEERGEEEGRATGDEEDDDEAANREGGSRGKKRNRGPANKEGRTGRATKATGEGAWKEKGEHNRGLRSRQQAAGRGLGTESKLSNESQRQLQRVAEKSQALNDIGEKKDAKRKKENSNTGKCCMCV
jgi:hypothetical protein